MVKMKRDAVLNKHVQRAMKGLTKVTIHDFQSAQYKTTLKQWLVIVGNRAVHTT